MSLNSEAKLPLKKLCRLILSFFINPQGSLTYWMALYRCRKDFGVTPKAENVYQEIIVTLNYKKVALQRLRTLHRKLKVQDSFVDFLTKLTLYRELNARICKVIEKIKIGADLKSLIDVRFFGDERWAQISNSDRPVVFFANHYGCDRLPQLLSMRVPKVAAITINIEGKVNNIDFIGVATPEKRVLSSALFLKAIKAGAYGVFYFDVGASVSNVEVRFFDWNRSMPAGIAKLIRMQPMSLIPTIAILDRNCLSRVTVHFGKPIFLHDQTSQMDDQQIVQKLVDALEEFLIEVCEQFPECRYQFHPDQT